MLGKRLLQLAAIALAFGVGVLVIQPGSILGVPVAPVVLRYVGAASADKVWAEEPTFWASNRTDYSLTIMVEAIEIQANQGWTNYYRVPPPNALWFTNNQMPGILLPPHATQLGRMLWQRIPPPTNTVWRVRANVAKMLTGAEGALAAAFREPEMLKTRRLTGSTNISANAKRFSRYGRPSPVVSEAVMPQ
jgi:hypothetical protein